MQISRRSLLLGTAAATTLPLPFVITKRAFGATIVKTIGSAGGRDYATVAAWLSAIPSNFVTDGNAYVGELYNDSLFNLGTSPITLNKTTSPTNNLTIRAATGQSFRDNASRVLNYNQANGVALQTSGQRVFQILSPCHDVILSGLQLFTAVPDQTLYIESTNFLIDDCIVKGGHSSGDIIVANGSGVIRNSLILGTVASMLIVSNGSGTLSLVFCDIVFPTDVTPAAANAFQNTGTLSLKNCAIFGAAAMNAAAPNPTFTTCMTDLAGGSGLSGSKVFSSQFVNTTAAGNWFIAATADLHNGTGSSDAITTDIYGTTRPQGGVWDIGASQLVAAAPTSSRAIIRSTF